MSVVALLVLQLLFLPPTTSGEFNTIDDPQNMGGPRRIPGTSYGQQHPTVSEGSRRSAMPRREIERLLYKFSPEIV